MTHVRTRVRQALVALLTDVTSAEERVFDSRRGDLSADELPALKVYTLEDNGGARELGVDGAQQRSLNLTLEFVIADKDGEDDDAFAARMDDFTAEAEAAIEADPTLGGVCANAEIEATSIAPSLEGSVSTWLAVMSVRVEAHSKGDQLVSGRLAAVTADGTEIGRLRSFGLSVDGEPPETTHAGSQWGTFNNGFAGRWTATLDMTLDDNDAGQALLGLKFERAFVFYPRGTASGQPAYAGAAIVTGVEESVGEDGDVVRTVTVTGNGVLS